MHECTERLAKNVYRATRMEPHGKLPHNEHPYGGMANGIEAGTAMYNRFYGRGQFEKHPKMP